jgi:uncharacterized protein YjbI with pentapeptide repeats
VEVFEAQKKEMQEQTRLIRNTEIARQRQILFNPDLGKGGKYMREYAMRDLLEMGEKRFSNVNLTGLNFSGCDFRGCDLRHTNFTSCGLNDAKFKGADFNHAQLHRSNLVGADLAGGKFDKVQAENAKVESKWKSLFVNAMQQPDWVD